MIDITDLLYAPMQMQIIKTALLSFTGGLTGSACASAAMPQQTTTTVPDSSRYNTVHQEMATQSNIDFPSLTGGSRSTPAMRWRITSEPFANCDSGDEPEDRSDSDAGYESSSRETEDKTVS